MTLLTIWHCWQFDIVDIWYCWHCWHLTKIWNVHFVHFKSNIISKTLVIWNYQLVSGQWLNNMDLRDASASKNIIRYQTESLITLCILSFFVRPNWMADSFIILFALLNIRYSASRFLWSCNHRRTFNSVKPQKTWRNPRLNFLNWNISNNSVNEVTQPTQPKWGHPKQIQIQMRMSN